MNTWKGFNLDDLRAFGVKRGRYGVEIPYYTRRGKHWRSKLFKPNGETPWLGEPKAQIPYGLETLNKGGPTVVLTEGESDALALRLAFPKLPVLGMPGADSWKPEWAVCLDEFRAIYLSFDGDGAGDGRHLPGARPRKLGANLAEKVRVDLPWAMCLRLPDRADTRDVLQQLGKPAFKLLVEEARASSELTQAHRALEYAVRRRQAVDEAWERRCAA